MRNLLFIIMIAVLSPYTVPGCEELLKKIPEVSTAAISNEEIIEGLKTALLIGTDSSVFITSRKDGFYKDELIKIMLPPEAKVIYENRNNALLRAAGIDKKIDEAVLALNRAAEDAAGEAGPIFRNSITNLSISEGITILGGKNPLGADSSAGFDSTAATGYLRSSTYSELSMAFSPKINASLDKVIVGNYSPNQIWNTLASGYNSIALKSFGLLEPMQNTDLGKYVTEKALDGLFLKVGEEEKKIRHDPFQWASTTAGNILKKVFGRTT